MKNKDIILLEDAYEQVQTKQLTPQTQDEQDETYNSQTNGNYTSIYLGFDDRGQVMKSIGGNDYNKLSPEIKTRYMQLTDKGYVFDVRTKMGSMLTKQNFVRPQSKQILDQLKHSFPEIKI